MAEKNIRCPKHPKCPVEYVERAGAVFSNEFDCVDLRGTKLLDPNLTPQFGPVWCPTLAARLGSMSLYPGSRAAVDAEMQRVASRDAQNDAKP
jgi:hypothetical protein